MNGTPSDLPEPHAPDTRSEEYADRLRTLSDARWKQVLDVQRPYRWNLERQGMGRTLDVGCGIGRNLVNLGRDSVGVDHNPESVDGMLVAHVLEHVHPEHWEGLVGAYLPYVKPGGTVMMICPQEKGYSTDSTHVHFTDGAQMADLAQRVGLEVEKNYSFPFPRFAGRFFPYNEFCLVARKPA